MTRARGDVTKTSDVDVFIESIDLIDRKILAQIRYALKESSLIYKIDLQDLKKILYLKGLSKKGIVWRSKNS